MPAIPKTETRVQKAEKPQTTYEEVSTAAPSKKSISIPKETLILALYAAGVVLTAAYMTMVNVRMGRKLRLKAQRVSMPGKIPVYRTNTETPRLAGLFRPRIYIGSETDAKMLEYVIAHETTHFKTGDNFWLLLKNIVCALYWFHPLVWVAGNAMMKDCEKACDERVVKSLSREKQLAYAEVLMRLSVLKSSFALVSNGMASQKGEMKMRISTIIMGKQTKRWMAAMMVILLLLTSVVSFATGEEAIRRVDMPAEIAEDAKIAIRNGKMVLLTEGKLYCESDAGWTLLGEYPDAVSIAADAGAVYISEAGENGDSISRIDAKGDRAETWNLPEGIRVRRLAVYTGGIALSAYAGYEYRNAMLPYYGKGYILNFAGGELKALPFEEMLDIVSDERGQLFALHEPMRDMPWVAKINTETGEYEDLVEVAQLGAQEIAVSDTGVYALNNLMSNTNYVDFVSFETGKSTRLINGDTLNIGKMKSMAYADGELRVICKVKNSTGEFECFEMDAVVKGKTRTLTIVVSSSETANDRRHKYVAQWFEENYPEVQIEFQKVGNPSRFATELMAGEGSIDIILDIGTSANTLTQSGAAMPISEVPGVMGAIAAADYVDYAPLMSWDGVQYGVPEYASFHQLRINEELLTALGLTFPEAPCSWRDIADWSIDALAGTEYKVYFDRMEGGHQYIDWQLQEFGEVNLDTPEFRNTMEAFRRMYQAGLLYERTAGSFDQDRVVVGNYRSIGPRKAYPTLEGIEANIANAQGLFVYRNTENLDLVSDYLKVYVSPECQYNAYSINESTMLLQDIAGYQEVYRQFLQWYFEEFNFRMEPDDEVVVAENDIRIEQYDNAVLYNRNWHTRIHNMDETQLYFDGEITIDEFIAAAQAKIDLVQYE